MGRGRGGRGKGGSAYDQNVNVGAQYAQQGQFVQQRTQPQYVQPQYAQPQGYPMQQPTASPAGSMVGQQYGTSPTNVRTAAPVSAPAPAPAPPQEVEDSMVIDKDHVKFLIGPQGKTVQQIRKSTKAQVTVSEAPAGSKYGKVTMKGTPAQVSDARTRITQVLATAETPVDDKAKEAKTPEKPVVKQEPEPEKTPSEEGKAMAERKAKLKTFLASPTCSKLAMGVGGVSGGSTGALVGTAVGLPAALFTFGLSIPVCAGVGGMVGGAVGVASGKVVGLGLTKVAQKL